MAFTNTGGTPSTTNTVGPSQTFQTPAGQSDTDPIQIGPVSQGGSPIISLIEFENPEVIEGLGGIQKHKVHQFIGGSQYIQTFGAFPTDISWRGLLLGQSALSRSSQLDAIRVGGNKVKFTYAGWNLIGIISRYNPTPHYSSYIPYSITFTPETDTAANTSLAAVGLLNPTVTNDVQTVLYQVQQDMTAYSQQPSLGTTILAAVSTVQTTIANIQTLIAQNGNLISSAITFAMNPNIQALASVASAMTGIIASGGPGNITTIPLSIQAEAALSQAALQIAAAAVIAADCINLNNTLSAGTKGSTPLSSKPQFITVANANLFVLAAQYYGDANQWTKISNANGGIPPFNSGVINLVIPPGPKPF